ncbi:uncharacterized protein LOC115182211 isoform X2 [Salmo trutta]|uniref:uncharacterized protein LOC115182211 isoform X2 n=1 Tax=Salmo trutta TaxID=8032 RepID=UPI0011316947|nr:uncharacterized protein LOC115182211 isoform X2 [Salmo trutta]
MSLLSHSPPVKEEVFWTEKGTIVKDEKEEEAVTVKKEVKGEAVTVKEDEDVFRVKEEDKEDDVAVTVKEEEDVFGVKGITVTLEEEEAEKTGDLINSILPGGLSLAHRVPATPCGGPGTCKLTLVITLVLASRLSEQCVQKFRRMLV